MPKKGPIFISKFLVPSLDDQKFGRRLMWIDKERAIFRMQWNHRANQTWTEYDAAVFTEWDKMKGRFHPSNKQYFTKSKQRFRAMLYKLISVHQMKELRCDDKKSKVFCIVRMLGKDQAENMLNNDYECHLVQDCRTEESTNVETIPENYLDEGREFISNSRLNDVNVNEVKNNFESALKDHLYVPYDTMIQSNSVTEEQAMSPEAASFDSPSSPLLYSAALDHSQDAFPEILRAEAEQDYYLPEAGEMNDMYINFSVLPEMLDLNLQSEMNEIPFINHGDALSRSVNDYMSSYQLLL